MFDMCRPTDVFRLRVVMLLRDSGGRPRVSLADTTNTSMCADRILSRCWCNLLQATQIKTQAQVVVRLASL